MADIATLGVKIVTTGDEEAKKKIKAVGAEGDKLLATEKRNYAQRLTAIRASYQAEIEAAQRAMRERLKSTVTVNEVNNIKNMYKQQVDAAQAAARAHVRTAQQAHLAATNGLRPMVAETEKVTAAVRRGIPTINTLRSSMTTLASSALSAAPGVTQLSSALGAMALGSGVMIGVMAAMAAVGFAWQKIAGDARESAAALAEANAELGRIGQNSGIASLSAALLVVRNRLDEINTELAELSSQPRSKLGMFMAGLGTAFPAIGGLFGSSGTGTPASDVARLTAERDKATQKVAKGEAEIARLNEAQRKEQETIVKQSAERARNEFLTAEEMKRQMETVRMLNREYKINAQGPGSPVVARQPGGMSQPSGGSFLGGIGDWLKGQFDPRQILSNMASGLLTGGVNMIMGAVTSFVGGLFNAGAKAKEAARLAREAQAQMDRAVQEWRGSLSGAFGSKLGNPIDDEFMQRFRDNPAFGNFAPGAGSPQQIIEWFNAMREAGHEVWGMADLASLIEKYNEALKKQADILDKELKEALEETARAAAEAAKQLQAAQQALGDSLSFAEFDLAGNQQAADELRATRQAEDWRKEAERLGMGEEFIGRIDKWLADRLAQIAAANLGTPVAQAAISAIPNNAAQEVVQSVVGITETSALRLVDIQRTALSYLEFLPRIYYSMNGADGGNVQSIDRGLGARAQRKGWINGSNVV
jgi:hypothetical protein